MHKKILSVLLTLVVFAGLMYWIWTLSIAWYIKIAITIGSIGVRFFIAALIGTKSSAVSDYTSNQSHSFSLPPWLLLPLAQVWGWTVKLAFVVVLFWLASFAWNHTSVATAFVPEQRMWSTGFVNRDGEEEWKLVITKKEDYLFMFPDGTRRRICNPHRVQRYFPNAGSTGNPNAIEREVMYTDYEVSQGVGAYVYHDGPTSYMKDFYMTLDPSVTGISRDTVTVWVLDKSKMASR